MEEIRKYPVGMQAVKLASFQEKNTDKLNLSGQICLA
jgi:hypothetical protein